MKTLTDMEIFVLVYALAISISYPLSILVWRYEFKKAYKETGNRLFLERCPNFF